MLKTGLHLDNRVLPTARDHELAAWLGPAGLKLMDNLGPIQLADLVARFGGDVQYAYRPFFPPPRHLEGQPFREDGSATPEVEAYHANWRRTVRAKVRDLFGELDRRLLPLRRPLLVQVYNEPNMLRGTGSWEGFGQTLGDLRAFDRLQILACDEIEGEFGSRVVVGWGPLTIGNRDVRAPGDPDDGVYYLNVCRASLERCRVLFTNQYPTADAPRDEFGDDGITSRYWGFRHKLYLERHPRPTVPVVIMEMAVQDVGRTAAFASSQRRADETVRWFRAIEQDPSVRVVYQWIAGDLDEPLRDAAFDFGRFSRGESFRPVALALRDYVARIADNTIPGLEPTPEPAKGDDPMFAVGPGIRIAIAEDGYVEASDEVYFSQHPVLCSIAAAKTPDGAAGPLYLYHGATNAIYRIDVRTGPPSPGAAPNPQPGAAPKGSRSRPRS